MTIPKIFDRDKFLSQHDGSDFAFPPLDKCVEYAQAIFETWLKENGKVVYGTDRFGGNMVYDTEQTAGDKWKALLICIEPIEKSCEKHEPEANAFNMFRCKHCKRDIKAKWEVVE